MNIETVTVTQMAQSLREMADDIEKGDLIAFVALGCDHEGTAYNCSMVDTNRATYDLLDEMVYSTKKMLFDSFEAEK